MNYSNNNSKWENHGGNINIYQDLTKSDIFKLIEESRIHSIQFYEFKNPSHQTWNVLNDFFYYYPHIGLSILWYDNLDFNFLEKISNVSKISVRSYLTKDFTPLRHMKHITSLLIGETKSISVDVSFIEELNNLEIISIDGMKKGLEKIQFLNKIWSLNLRGVKLNNLDWIMSLTNLRLLKLMFGSYKSLDGIKQLQNLKYLGISRVRQISSYHFLSSLTNLEFLHFEGMAQIEKLSNLSGLQNLKKLQVENLSRLEDISEISKLLNLEELIVWFAENANFSHRQKILKQAANIALHLPKLRLVNFLSYNKYIQTADLERKGIEIYKHEKSKWKQNIEGGWVL